LNFDLDREEREIINSVGELTRAQMWELLESKRFADLNKNGLVLRGNMISQARCPVCTLEPPCKHYELTTDIMKDASDLLDQPDFKSVIPPHKRDNLLQALKKKVEPLQMTRRDTLKRMNTFLMKDESTVNI
jgi:hypothetical protein